MALATLASTPWQCQAVLSWHSSDWWVQIEHDDPEQGGWVRYALTGDRVSGMAYFATRKAAEAAIHVFLDDPSLTRCCTQ